MNEIKCPHCGEVFKVDASGYADIVKQVRDAEFSRDLDERVSGGSSARASRRWSLSVRVRRLPCRRRSLNATLSLSSRRTLRIRNWRKRLPSAMLSLPSCALSSRALPQSARVQASARRLRHEPMLKKRMPNSSVRLIACVRSLGAKMTKQSLPSRRRATLLKTI